MTAESPAESPLSRLRALYRERRAFRWAVELLALALIVLGISVWQTRHHVRGAAPSLRLATLDGRPTTLAAATGGKRALVYVWAPWCGVCKAESQNVRWVRSLLGSRAQVVSIATGFEHVDEVRRYMADHAVDYPVLLDDGSAARALKVEAFPTTYFVDEAGNLSGSVAGYTTTFGLWWRTIVQ
jgi:thiol-disulfide isomerase/thioredoxin